MYGSSEKEPGLLKRAGYTTCTAAVHTYNTNQSIRVSHILMFFIKAATKGV